MVDDPYSKRKAVEIVDMRHRRYEQYYMPIDADSNR